MLNYSSQYESLVNVLKAYGYVGNVNFDTSISYADRVESIIKYKQGDASRVNSSCNKAKYGFDFERPFYLYDELVDKNKPTNPQADKLGFSLAEELALKSGLPLVEVLPKGVNGVILLTGDDDQAYLEKYDEQLKLIKDFPITYFLHPLTRHTEETLSKYPKNVSFGVHPDALEDVEGYDAKCEADTQLVTQLIGASVSCVRNHGFLSKGYQGHLNIWEKLNLIFDVNIPGVDGTALNGSYLPMKLRKEDGSWSNHYSLLSTFGDGMIFAQKMSERQGVKKIKKLAKQIERTFPGVLVFNFHPQNISSTKKLHKAVIKIGKKRNWLALSMNEYLNWLYKIDSIKISKKAKGFLFESSYEGLIKDLVIKIPKAGKWEKVKLPSWSKLYEFENV